MPMKKFKKSITNISKKVYKFIDKVIVTPISKLVYIVGNKLTKGYKLEKILNRPNTLVYISLGLALILFVLIDTQKINLTETTAEVIKADELKILYNTSAYVVEGLPDDVEIVLTGKKSELYLANRLGEHIVTLDLTDYEASEEPQKVKLSYSKPIDSLDYKIVPDYVVVTIKEKVSDVKSISYDLLNPDKLNEKLSVKSIELLKEDTTVNEVVVKGSKETLEKVASVKALVDLNNKSFTESGTYTVDNVNLVAYDDSGEIMDNVEIVSTSISAKIVLDSYSKEVPVKVLTTGDLVAGKAINSIEINGKTNYNITIYGESSVIDAIESVPLTIDISGQGNSNNKSYNLTISKPSGVRYMSETSATIDLKFAEAKQKTIKDVVVEMKNIPSGYSVLASTKDDARVDVQIVGVSSVIDSIENNNITAFIDLAGYTTGEYTINVQIEGGDARVKYIVTKSVEVIISK